MATEVTPTEFRNRLYDSYNLTWKFLKYEFWSESVKTAAFSPISGSDLTFHFEIRYKEFFLKDETVENLKICFVKSCGVNIPRHMKMDMKLSINHLFDGSVFKEYKRDSLSVEKMGMVTVANEIFKTTNNVNFIRKTILGDFNLNCCLMFYDHFNSLENYYKSMRSLKNLQQFTTDFSCLYQSGQPTVPEVVEDVGKKAKRAKKRAAEKECVIIFPEAPTVQQSGNLLHDLKIIVDNQTFNAHKSILAAHSPVIFQMLCHEFQTSVIYIRGFSTETTGCFIKYLYTGEIDDKSWSTIQELYSMAFKYDVHTLMRDCGEISATFLSVDTVCEILKMAYEYRDDFLKLEATKFALKHIKELILKVEWKDMINLNLQIGYDVMKKCALKLD